MRIFAEYSLWFVPLCIAIGVLSAYFLYRRDAKLQDAPPWVLRLLFALRALAVALLLFLLLGPYLERRKKSLEKPVIVLLHDNSASLVQQKDSLFYRNEYRPSFLAFRDKLKSTFTVDDYEFGETVRDSLSLSYTDKQTDISSALEDIAVRYYGQNVGAVVLATDGIYNAGENPKYALQSLPTTTPVYAIALGDTVQGCDNVISHVLHNQIAFRDNPFTIRISAESHGLRGQVSKITVTENNTVLAESSFKARSDHEYKTIDCSLKSSTVGRKIITVNLQYFDTEVTDANNTYTFAIDVLESRQKILMLYESPHPDVAALRRALTSNANYECTCQSITKGNIPDLRDYNAVVLVGLPSASAQGKTILDKVVSAGVSALVVYTPSLNIPVLNAMAAGVTIDNYKGSTDEVQALFEEDFSLFAIDESVKHLMNQGPPLMAPYGAYTTGVQSRVLFSQRVGGVAVSRPLVLFSQVQSAKVGMILGEGLWRLRMYDHRTNGSFEAFDSFINKTLAYIALTEKKEVFSINTESIVYEHQPVHFVAELYDKSFEPMVNQEISLVITNENKTEFPFVFTSSDNFYTLQAGKFPQGNYTYVASVTVDGTVLTKRGSFTVLPLLAEFAKTQADHAVLRDMALQTNGAVYGPRDLDSLCGAIEDNQNIVPVSHVAKHRELWLNMPLVLLLLIFIMASEWFLRKYYASY